jgi:hypothetical protein
MATLALSTIGSAIGDEILPGLGGFIGEQAGKYAGASIDKSLFGSSGQGRAVEGPRLHDLHVTASTEGAAVPRVYGRARLGGQVIWATDFEEVATAGEPGGSGAGKGGAGGVGTGGPARTSYQYYANFAVGLCEGEISGVGRIWSGGRELDLSGIAYRIYTGTETQTPDSLVAARLGAAAPAFRGLAYVVFERLDLTEFGNRLPQLSFEVFRAADAATRSIKGVVLIPGSGEFAMATSPVTRNGFGGMRLTENANTALGATDFSVAVDQLEAALPNVGAVSLVSSWFGDDLRAGDCRIRPCVERREKDTEPLVWSVAGETRATARVVSQRDGRPAYGGTPSDETVIAATRHLTARGLAVTLTPFLLMDVPAGNTLPDPYAPGQTQPAFPWRGRITCSPAPGVAGTPDKTAAAAGQLAAFIGTAAPAHFTVSGDTIAYTGPAEWSLRRFVLHHACLAKAAGGVTAFVIGSELRGLSTIRGAAGTYPFVAALVQLAADVRTILGAGVKITYAADWSEYFGHQPADGSGDAAFHLDPLWASPAIDAVGIDMYWPLADWRTGRDHLDAIEQRNARRGAASPYDLAYLKSRIDSGEGYDWYYASDADRAAQVRSPITDGLGKPWLYRYKDLKSWWLNRHYNRTGGVEAATPTAWVPQSKPVWFMEIGCPAVDFGANQPNVFVDPKSVESHLPYFSSGRRDDLMQRRYIQALTEAYDSAHAGRVPGLNPVSTVYGGPMVPPDRIHVYAWDTRPYPAFPNDTDTWSDGDNWRLGHWLNGRVASQPLAEVVRRIMLDCGQTAFDTSGLSGMVPGYVVDRIMSPRDALQALELAYFFDSLESDGRIVFRHRGAEPPVAAFTEADLVETSPGAPLLKLTRGQETDLPAAAKIGYLSTATDYHRAVCEARRLSGASGRVSQADLAILLDPDQAGDIAESWLFEVWAARERASCALPPSRLAVEPGDAVTVTRHGRRHLLRVTEIGDRGPRDIEARGLDPDVYDRQGAPQRVPEQAAPPASGKPLVYLLDLPLLSGDEPVNAGYIAAAQTPWPGALAVYQSPETTGFMLKTFVNASSVVGETLSPLAAGPLSRLDRGTRLTVRIGAGQLASVTRAQLLDGRNACAVRNGGGDWEVLQFGGARLVGPATYELSDLLRAQGGTDGAMPPALAPGAAFVMLGPGVATVDLTADQTALPFQWRVGAAGKDLGGANFTEATYAFKGIANRPLSPVHVRGRRLANGDLAIGWVRRTRAGGDSWSVPEVPLAETAERYEIDILGGAGVVKRTLSVSVPAAAYTAADQTADFGSPQPGISLRIYQMSAVGGRGTPRAATL